MACDNVEKCLQQNGVVNYLQSTCDNVNVNGIQGDVDLTDMCLLFPDENGGSGNGSGFLNDVWQGIGDFDFGIVNSAYCNLYPLLNNGQVPPECRTGASTGTEASQGSPPQQMNWVKIILIIAVIGILSFVGYRLIKK